MSDKEDAGVYRNSNLFLEVKEGEGRGTNGPPYLNSRTQWPRMSEPSRVTGSDSTMVTKTLLTGNIVAWWPMFLMRSSKIRSEFKVFLMLRDDTNTRKDDDAKVHRKSAIRDSAVIPSKAMRKMGSFCRLDDGRTGSVWRRSGPSPGQLASWPRYYLTTKRKISVDEKITHQPFILAIIVPGVKFARGIWRQNLDCSTRIGYAFEKITRQLQKFRETVCRYRHSRSGKHPAKIDEDQ